MLVLELGGLHIGVKQETQGKCSDALFVWSVRQDVSCARVFI